ncbi:MAG: ATP-dependent DNA ligase [Candidatus Dependentiae bacterium]|nr:ATP-dependent DNA ligase [Candidatus Dependentiae bacterium]
MEFDNVASCFERVEQVSSRLEITRLLAELLHEVTPQEASIVCNFSLGQLNPPYKGTHFNLAIKNVIKATALALGIPQKEVEEQVKKAGDVGLVIATGNWYTDTIVGDVVCDIQSDFLGLEEPLRIQEEPLSIQQVYDALRSIEQTSGTGSQEEKITQLVALIKRVSPESAKYIVRIILDTLRLGFSDMTLIDALSWMYVGDKSVRKSIEDAYNVCADLGFIAALLKQEGIKALEDMVIRMGIPIRPASAERLPTANAIIEKIGVAVAQPKLDGFRVQIHVNKAGATPEIHFFSRNLQDISYMFPDLIPALLELPVTDIIIEGEVICFDQHTGNFLPFQETAKRKRKHDIEQAIIEFPLKVFIFDLLYLNGQSQLAKTHMQRRNQLLELLQQYKNDSVLIVDEVAVHTGKELEDYFLESVSQGLEGIVVKRPDAIYQPGKRNFNWIKLKRQEAGHLEDTIDCVVLGYYAGSGKRAHFGIGAFLVGVFNPQLDSFQTVAKVGTGLTDSEWRALKIECDKRAVADQPRNIICFKDLAPDVWVWPEIICLVRADELTMSPVHTAGKTDSSLGYALRFPRIMGYREDKGAKEATTADEIKRLYQDQFIR